MKQLKTKLRWLVLPLLLCTILFNAAYSLLHWFIIIKNGVGINYNVVQAYIPIILAFIVAWKQMRPRIYALKLGKHKGRNRADLYYIIAALTIAATTVFTQLYLSTSTAAIMRVTNIAEIESREKVKYYELKEYYVDKNRAGEYLHIYSSGRYGTSRHYELFMALPIYARVSDTITASTSYFLALKYHTSVSSSMDEAAKRVHIQQFFEDAYDSFRNENVNRFSYLERLGNNGEMGENMRAVSKSRVQKSGKWVVFFPRHGAFEERNGGKFGWIFKSFAIGFGLWLIMIAFPGINYNEIGRKKKRL